MLCITAHSFNDADLIVTKLGLLARNNGALYSEIVLHILCKRRILQLNKRDIMGTVLCMWGHSYIPDWPTDSRLVKEYTGNGLQGNCPGGLECKKEVQ